MGSRIFPGAPEGFSHVFSQNLLKASEELKEHGTKYSQDMSEVYRSFSLCLLVPRAYFDLFMKTGAYYDEMREYWSKEIYSKNKGSGDHEEITFTEIQNAVGVDTSIINELEVNSFNLLLAMLSFTSDNSGAQIPAQTEEAKEQFAIINRIFWGIYISLFSPKFFEKNHKVFVDIEKQALVEFKEFQRMSQN